MKQIYHSANPASYHLLFCSPLLRCAGLLALLLIHYGSHAQITCDPSAPVSYPSGGYEANGVTAADFNGDGKPDLAVANGKDPGSVGVLLGMGDGRFSPVVAYPSSGLNAQSLTVSDFNGDGKKDLAFLGYSVARFTYEVGVLLGKGDGTFLEAKTYSAGYNPTSIAAADFNGDGKDDLAFNNAPNAGFDGYIGVLLAQSNGGFAQMASYPCGAYNPVSIAAGDYNGDGKPDVAVANEYEGNGNNLGLLLGEGDGSLAPVFTFPSGATVLSSIASNDLNKDGIQDLMVGHAGKIEVLLGKGKGTFAAPATYPTGFYPGKITAADFNGDSKKDLAVINQEGISTLFGKGNGKFVPTITYLSGSRGLTAADFNGDGKDDLAVTGSSGYPYNAGIVRVLLNNIGIGEFAPSVTYSSGGNTATSTSTADFNKDGKADLAVANKSSNTIGILLGNGTGLLPAVTYPSGGKSPLRIDTADFNKDGKPDLFVLDSSAIGVVLGNGDGSFTATTSYATGGNSPCSVAKGDFDRNGTLDLAVLNSASATVGVLLGNGKGGFATAITYPTGGHRPQFLTAGDFNGDGKIDLANASDEYLADKAGIGLLLGKGDGSFAPPVAYEIGGSHPRSLTAADFNGDGKQDLVFTEYFFIDDEEDPEEYDEVSLLLGSSDGFLAGTKHLLSNYQLYGVFVHDLNKDNKPDLYVGTGGSITVLLGKGDGNFVESGFYLGGDNIPEQLAIGDFNGDGKEDLALAGSGGYPFDVSNIGLLLGKGDGSFTPDETIFGGDVFPGLLTAGDYNGDGKPDLAFVSTNPNATNNVGVLLKNCVVAPQSVTRFTLVNAATGQDIQELREGNILNLALFPHDKLNIRAATEPAAVGSVVFELSGGKTHQRTENGVPYALFGDNNGDYAKGTLDTGEYTLTATPYSKANGKGAKGSPLSIHFKIIYHPAASGCLTQSFAPAVAYPTGSYSSSVVPGDYNKDGTIDFAVANPSLGTVAVLLGEGDGSFAPAISSPGGGNQLALKDTGDFNGDGYTDLVGTNFSQGTIGVLLGKGDGNFAPMTAYSSGGVSPNDVATGDFNDDGNRDVAVANIASPNIGVLLGKGDGSFAAVKTYSNGGTDLRSITTSDLNSDGKLDLAVANGLDKSKPIGVLFGNGKGGFAKAVHYPSGGDDPISITTSDVNNDGKTDLIFAHYGGPSTVGVLVGDGSGKFAAPVIYFSGGNGSSAIASHDFNGDGELDVAILNAYSANVGVLLGYGNDGFDAATTYPSGVGSYLSSLIATDFNGDGKADLAVANGDGNIGVLLSTCGSSTLPSVSSFTLVNAAAEQDIQALRDGDVLDLTSLPHARLNIRAGTNPAKVGSVAFELSGALTQKQVENGVPYALFKNLKGDYFGGNLQPGDYTLTATPYSKADGKGEKGTPLTVHFKVVYPASVTMFTLVDAATGKDIQELKEGGVLKVATLPSKLSIRATTSPDTVGSVVFNLTGQQSHTQTENLAPYALYGGNTKTYTPWAPQAGKYTLTAAPFSAPEGLGAKGTKHTISFTVINPANCTTQSFDPAGGVGSGDYIFFVLSGDFNNDGKLDLAFADGEINYVSVVLGDGAGHFAKGIKTYFSGYGFPGFFASGDFNGDGKLDLVIQTDEDYEFHMLLGDGTGHFTAGGAYSGGGAPSSVTTKDDFNGDGKLDEATVVNDNENSYVQVLLGNDSGGTKDSVAYPIGFPGNSIVSGDFNSDGKPDLAVGHEGGAALYLNTCGAPSSIFVSKASWKPLFALTEKSVLHLSVYPNPFSSHSTVRFSVPNTGYTTLNVHDAKGVTVARLYQGTAEGKREYRVSLEGKGLSAGVYLLRLTTDKQTSTLKTVLLR